MPSLSPARSIFVDRIMSIAACGSGQSAGVHTTEEQGAQCVEDFKGILYKMQDARKTLVADLLNEKRVDESLLDVLKFTLRQLTDSRTIGDLRQIQTPSATFQINISDEVRGLKKDVKFLDKLISLMAKNGMVDDIWETMDIGSILAPYHPKGTDTFHEELQKVTSLLLQLTSHTEGPKPMFITDWDGTMKDYTSQYATNLQPVYSGVLMGRFAAQFTRLSAVLTAGPLRGPGILDLTSLPKNGHVKFSGSWGREWWLGGKRVVHDFGVTEEAFDAIGRLSDEMAELLSNGDFSQFTLVGSGVQKKVDRLTLGVQTVFNTVPPELTARYIDAVKERIHRVDPNGLLLQLEDHNTLEIEVCATSAGTENGEAKVWDKGDGVAALVEQLHDDLSVGKVLVAGDTTSDLPMLKNIQSKNPDGVMALFIGVNPSLQEAVLSIVGDPLRCSFPSSPDVVHAAFSQLLFVNKCLD